MKVKSAVHFGIIALLAITILAGCYYPPLVDDFEEPSPMATLTAKEAWAILSPVRETFSDNVAPVYISGGGGYDQLVTEGRAPSWSAGFYSNKANAVWNFGLDTYYYEDSAGPTPDQGERLCGHISLEAYDLDFWDIDSPEACAAAAQNGAGEIMGMCLQAAGHLEFLDEESSIYKTPEFIPESTKLLWVVAGENGLYYIDACNGKYLGSCTSDHFAGTPAPPPVLDTEAPAADPQLYLGTDARGELFRRYETGADIGVNYSVHSTLDADEYRVTYSYNGITLISPAVYSTNDPAASFGLQFSPAGEGKGRIIVKLTAFRSGKAIGEAYSCLYLSPCSRGVYLSAYSGALADLAMAKARFDAFEIASYDYYEIVRNNFVIDADLMAKLGRNSSSDIERYGYAERYVEAVNDYIFGIEPED